MSIMLNSNLRGMHAPKPKLSKWAYTGVVRPKLLYACMTHTHTHTHTHTRARAFKMQEHATIYQAKLEVIYQACKYMNDNHDTIKPKYVKILTDSQAALKLLDSIDFKSTIALQTGKALENLKWRVKGVH